MSTLSKILPKHGKSKVVVLPLLIMLLLSSPFFVQAVSEAPLIEWQRFFNGTHGWSVLQTKNGGYAITGDNETTSLLIETDSSGNLLWAKTYQIGEKATSLPHLVSTADGGYALAGTWENQIALAKVTADGIMQWNKTYAYDMPFIVLRSFTQTNDEGYALAVLCLTEAGPHGRGKIWLLKVNSQGEIEWNTTIVGTLGEYPNSILQTSDGGYIVTGTSWSPGFPSYFKLIKTDPNGNEQWNKTYGGEGEFYTTENEFGIITNDGGFILSGFVVDEDADWTAWLIKTDSQGNARWNNTYEGEDSVANTVIQTQDGGYAFTGAINRSTAWTVKTDDQGVMDWNLTFIGGSFIGDSIEEFGNSIIQTDDGGYILLGTKDEQIWLFKITGLSEASFPLEVAAVAIFTILMLAVLIIGFRKKIFRKK